MMHDTVIDKIAWFTYQTKCGAGSNQEPLAKAAESDISTQHNDICSTYFNLLDTI